MADTEQGGRAGLVAWLGHAWQRCRELMPPDGGRSPDPEGFDAAIGELEQLERLLADDEEWGRRTAARLGMVLAVRYAAGGPPQDRARAAELLRRSRAAGPGAPLPADERQAAALMLMTVVFPVNPTGLDPQGRKSDVSDVLSWLARNPEAAKACEEEVQALAAEVKSAPLPDVLGSPARLFLESLDDSDPTARMKQALDAMPHSNPNVAELRTMLHLVSELGKAPRKDRTGDDPDVVRRDSELAEIGSQAMLPAMLDLLEASRAGDPARLERALLVVREAHARMPPDHPLARILSAVAGPLLHMAGMVGGSHQDAAAGGELIARLAQLIASDPTGELAPMGLALKVMLLGLRIEAARHSGDPGTLDEVIDELHELEAVTPAGHDQHVQTRLFLGVAYGQRGLGRNDRADLLRAAQYLEHTPELPAFAFGLTGDLPARLAEIGRLTRAALDGDPQQAAPITEPGPDAPLRERWGAASALHLRWGLFKDPADLDRTIDQLMLFRAGLRDGLGVPFAPAALDILAQSLRERSAATGSDADASTATEVAREALRHLGATVALQLGAEHGLLAARSGAEYAVRAARWAAGRGQVEEAVDALELGRALVLRAASAAASVPEQLAALGHEELAAAWRESGGAQPGDTDELPRELPSRLRREALKALGYRDADGGLFTTPTVGQLTAGLADCGADALVYLIAGEGAEPGQALVIGPETGTAAIALPLLSGPGRRPLDTYLDAAADRDPDDPDRRAEAVWEEALSELCDWAFPAALSPVLALVNSRIAARPDRRDRPGPMRLVLVACGRLGVVPWHAARLPRTMPFSYACQVLAVSYAASGGQFLRAAARDRRAPGEAPVLVADPRMELTRAEQEVTWLREACYPRARLLGDFYEPSVRPEGPGTPDEVLAALRGPLSLLHVASHGSAGIRPTVSALHLALPDGREPGMGDEDFGGGRDGGAGSGGGRSGGGSDGGHDAGMLTVTRLLDGGGPDGPAAPDGPLVVLSACETDLSTRDHDEALTLATAFVANGARDVVGSRWTTRDSASALMMAVFHHHVAVEGRSPADALREAQLWMLDPGRRDPGTLDGELLREATRQDLDRLPYWAAFIHQGNPGC
ncbi:CHAT domain-containing protein [Streptomyces sp. NPDC002073]